MGARTLQTLQAGRSVSGSKGLCGPARCILAWSFRAEAGERVVMLPSKQSVVAVTPHTAVMSKPKMSAPPRCGRSDDPTSTSRAPQLGHRKDRRPIGAERF